MRAWHFSNYPSSSVRFSRPARSTSRRGTGEKAPPGVGPARPPESQKRNHGLLLVPIVTTVTRISAPKSPCNGANAPPLLANEKGKRWHGSDPGRRRPACANGQREGRADGQGAPRHPHEVDHSLDTSRPSGLPYTEFSYRK